MTRLEQRKAAIAAAGWPLIASIWPYAKIPPRYSAPDADNSPMVWPPLVPEVRLCLACDRPLEQLPFEPPARFKARKNCDMSCRGIVGDRVRLLRLRRARAG